MKRILFLVGLFLVGNVSGYEVLSKVADPTLDRIFHYYTSLTPRDCDICEHMLLLRDLAKECDSVVEIGLGPVISTWGILKGLSESSSQKRSYHGVDIVDPPLHLLSHAEKLAKEQGIAFRFEKMNDLELELEPTDFLFIDSMHTYCHLTYELETFSPMVRKIIAMHDTSEPWGNRDDGEYQGDYSEYPPEYDRSKQGLWQAVVDFLGRHPEWNLEERRLNCHGFTVLRRRV